MCAQLGVMLLQASAKLTLHLVIARINQQEALQVSQSDSATGPLFEREQPAAILTPSQSSQQETRSAGAPQRPVGVLQRAAQERRAARQPWRRPFLSSPQLSAVSEGEAESACTLSSDGMVSSTLLCACTAFMLW